MPVPDNLDKLIEKFLNGEATEEERARLNAWYHSHDDSLTEIPAGEPLSEEELGLRIRERLQDTLRPVVPFWRQTRTRAAAAAILLLLVSSLYLLVRPAPETALPVQADLPVVKDIEPGGNRAILTLADGSVIVLDSTNKGWLQEQGAAQVQKKEEGWLTYQSDQASASSGPVLYNTISTPRGGQYQVTLSDGTRVWLNAASSIRFPVVFTGTERRVEVTGETYFEVAKNPAMPFRVKARQTEVEVLGTHFNLNAYEDESAIRTTLLEGRVKVSVPDLLAAQPPRFLSPGQQSGVQANGKLSIASGVDTEETVAWIKGRFQFRSADLRSILRQIARWYDVDIEYRGPVDLHFTGQLTRNQQVSKVLETLALTGEVRFRIENRKIIVSR